MPDGKMYLKKSIKINAVDTIFLSEGEKAHTYIFHALVKVFFYYQVNSGA